MFLYAFGLIWRLDSGIALHSNLSLSEQASSESGLIVCLSEGFSLPRETDIQPGLSRGADGGWIFGVPSVARYEITPDKVIVHSLEQADPTAVQMFLWGSAIGTVLHLRGILPLHGSTVRLPDGTAAVFCGHTGAGKSTTVAALGKRGLATVADDVSVIKFDDYGKPWVYPGLPRAKLWRHALNQLGMIPGQQIRAGIEKYYAELPICAERLPLSRMYELDVKQSGCVVMTPIEGIGRVTALLTHTYRPSFISKLGLQAAHLARVSYLAPHFKMARITRPRGEFTLNEIAELVLKGNA
jgi:hypothetical protein